MMYHTLKETNDGRVILGRHVKRLRKHSDVLTDVRRKPYSAPRVYLSPGGRRKASLDGEQLTNRYLLHGRSQSSRPPMETSFTPSSMSRGSPTEQPPTRRGTEPIPMTNSH